ncbi:MAG: hypothetical protein RR374_06890 [Clostridia bacterium]
MINKFKKYLEAEFRSIAPTKEAMEYREEVLGNLLDKAQELKIKGMKDEDLIYDLCIESLGDFKSTLKNFESKRLMVTKAAKKASTLVVGLIALVFFVTLTYLVVSLATGAWSKTWLLMVGGIFGIIVAGFGAVIVPKALNSKKYFAMRFGLQVSLTLILVFLYLVILMMFPQIEMSWTIFLFLPIILIGADTLFAFAINSKTRFVELIAFVPTFSSLLYVFLGVMSFAPWHPFWLIPVFGAFIDVVILGALVYMKSNKEKTIKIEKQAGDSESFYTSWSDDKK